MRPELVSFDSHPNSFSVRISQCSNPMCDCNSVTFSLVEEILGDEDEETQDSYTKSRRLDIHVNPDSWQEISVPERSPEDAVIVKEFLRDYPLAERLYFQEYARKNEKIRRRLREFRLNPRDVEESRLISWNTVASDVRSISEGGRAYSHRIDLDGQEFLIDDLYCPNPNCDCGDFSLNFFAYTPSRTADDKGSVDACLTAQVSLDGKVKLVERIACSLGIADEAMAAWQEEHGSELEMFRQRYKCMKEIGRRSAPPPQTSRSIPSSKHPGRNEPCPCGSGKKYKKCCGM